MNEATKLNGLSYKQLQALALQYKVPGNIRKHVLIKLLEAVKVDDHLEVDRIIREQYQNRKKRVKKSDKHLDKIFHPEPNSNYNSELNNNIRNSGNASQGQWMFNAEREAVNRPQIPNYSEFNRFIVGEEERTRDEYVYHGNSIENTNEISQSPAIVDLRINPRRMNEWNESTADMYQDKRLTVQFSHEEASIIDYKNYNYDIDTSQHMIQYGSPRLLKKMLQAPAGVNLKQLISYEDSYDITPITHDRYDDSDTLTAESDCYINDNHVDCNNLQNNNNWLDGNTQNIFNGYGNQAHLQHHHHTMEHYGLNENSSSEVIENCQKWLANSSSSLLNNNDNNHSTTNIIDNDNYNQNHHSYEMKSCDNSLYYETDNNNVNQWEYSHEHHQHFETMEQVVDGNIQQQNCHNQWTSTAYSYLEENRETFYDSHNVFGNNAQQPSSNYEQVDIKVGDYYNSTEQQRYSKYIKDNDYKQRGGGDFDGAAAETNIQEPSAGSAELLDQMCETNFASDELDSSVPGNIMNCYWPQWSSSYGSKVQKSKVNYKLENLLNLEITTSYQVEQLKSDQTSCVYCYTSPIVTQRIFASSPSPSPSPSIHRSHIDSNNHQGSSSTLTTYCLPYDDDDDDDDDTLNCNLLSNTTTTSTSTDLSLQSQRLWTCTVAKNSTTLYDLKPHANTINADQLINGNPWMSDYV